MEKSNGNLLTNERKIIMQMVFKLALCIFVIGSLFVGCKQDNHRSSRSSHSENVIKYNWEIIQWSADGNKEMLRIKTDSAWISEGKAFYKTDDGTCHYILGGIVHMNGIKE